MNEKNKNVTADLCNEDDEYLFVHINAFNNLFQFLHCENCDSKGAQFQITQRFGFAVKISAMCLNCEEVCVSVESSPKVNQSNRSSFDINEIVVAAFQNIGSGLSAIENVSAVLKMHCFSNNTYYKHLSTVVEEAGKLKHDVLSKSREIVHETHTQLNAQSDTDIVDIMASYDGTYHKRGFTSLYGLGFVFDVITGLIVDYEVMSKYCHQCVCSENFFGSDTPDFDIWFQHHKNSGECGKNYSGSSVSMEVAAADILWRRSVEDCKMRYLTLLSDGDAKTFRHLSNEKIYNDDIQKEECINHVSKRMTTALREQVKKSKVLGITLGGKSKGALTDKVIGILATYYRNAILRNKDNVVLMQKEIMATLLHCSSTDENPDHSLCPRGKDSWCFYNKANAKKVQPHSHGSMSVFLNKKVVEQIQPIYERLSNPELLNRCTKGLTQNANEALHSVLWRKCPKEIFVSKKKIDIAAAHAVAEFNMGALKTAECLISYKGRIISSNTKKICEMKDRKRLSQSDCQSQVEQKKLRVYKKSKKTQKETKKVRVEGPSYGAGQFDT